MKDNDAWCDYDRNNIISTGISLTVVKVEEKVLHLSDYDRNDQIMTGMTLDKKSNIKEINRLINVAIAEGVVHYVRNALKNTSFA